MLGVVLDPPKPRISCQLQPIEMNKKMSLFDLQTVGFLALKNATIIAEWASRRSAYLVNSNPTRNRLTLGNTVIMRRAVISGI
jgi:hypothetical protein